MSEMFGKIDLNSVFEEFAREIGKSVNDLSNENKRDAIIKHVLGIKILSEDDDIVRVGGYGIVFGGEDLLGEFFDNKTDLMLGLIPKKPILYEHGYNDTLKDTILGNTTKEVITDMGVWVEAELDKHEEYVRWVTELMTVGGKVLGWSSGSYGGLVRYDKSNPYRIDRWPVIEYSLTVRPAEPRTLGVDFVRSLFSDNEAVLKLLEGSLNDPGQVKRVEVVNNYQLEDKMNDNDKSDVNADNAQNIVLVRELADEVREIKANFGEFTAKFGELSKSIDQIMDAMETIPAIRNSGYYSHDGGRADAANKSFGDFLKAVMRNDEKRIYEVYHAKAALSEGSGETGGFLVPEEYIPRLMQVAGDASIVRSRATVITAQSKSGSIPALDQQSPPTAGVGQTAFAGGVRAYWTSEGAAATETEPEFKEIKYTIGKLSGYSLVSDELIEDSPQAIETLLVTLFGRAVASLEDFAFLRGTGVGMPLGVLNWSGLINVTPQTNNQFGLADALNMLSHFLPVSSNPVWLMHRSVIPDMSNFTVTAGEDLVQPRETLPTGIFGYPVLYSEHLPQADNSGDVLLADFGAYVIFDRRDLSIRYSPHYQFVQGRGTWLFSKRLDGKPWLTNYVTLADPQGGYTVSPFVSHND